METAPITGDDSAEGQRSADGATYAPAKARLTLPQHSRPHYRREVTNTLMIIFEDAHHIHRATVWSITTFPVDVRRVVVALEVEAP